MGKIFRPKCFFSTFPNYLDLKWEYIVLYTKFSEKYIYKEDVQSNQASIKSGSP